MRSVAEALVHFFKKWKTEMTNRKLAVVAMGGNSLVKDEI